MDSYNMASSRDGKTELVRAIENGDIELVERLVKDCVDLEEKDKSGRTAVYYAQKLGNSYILEILRKGGAYIDDEKKSRVARMETCHKSFLKRDWSDDDNVNRILRTSDVWSYPYMKSLVERYMALKDLIPVKRKFTCWRGIATYPGFRCQNPKKGDIVELKGFSSFTMSKEIAEEFVIRSDSDPNDINSMCILEWEVPAGIDVVQLGDHEDEIFTFPNIKIQIKGPGKKKNINVLDDYDNYNISIRFIPIKLVEVEKFIGNLPGVQEWYEKAKKENRYPSLISDMESLGMKTKKAFRKHVSPVKTVTPKITFEHYFRVIYTMASQYSHTKQEYKDLINSLIESDPSLEEYRDDLFEASQFQKTYRDTGIVVLKHIYPVEECREFVGEFWEYILSLPYKPEIKREIEETINRLGLIEDPWKSVKKKDVAALHKYYPMTGSFGALTMPPAFHMKGSWKARQDPVIISVYRALLGVQEIETTIDRVSFRMPGQGESEFTHWDSNPFTWPEEDYESIQGILALSETSFRAVPGTHTDVFQQKFTSLYPPNKRHDQYFVGLDKNLNDVLSDMENNDLYIPPRLEKENDEKYTKRLVKILKKHDKNYKGIFDPMNLREKVETFPIGIGDYVIWSNRLLHEARKNSSDKIRYAFYNSYYPAGNPCMNVQVTHRKKDIDYYADRLESYRTGKNPYAYPNSGTEIKMWSQRAWSCKADSLKRFCDMWIPEETPCIDKQPKNKGVPWPIVKGWDPLKLGIYSPPPLSAEGWRLLGIDIENDKYMTIGGQFEEREIPRCGE